MTNNTNRQYNLLQVLRAYAAFLVIYEHLFGSYIDLILKQHNFYSDFISNFIFKPLGIIDHGGAWSSSVFCFKRFCYRHGGNERKQD